MMTTKILFATDVHGSEKSFLKFLNAGKIFKIDVLVLSGDLTGKSLIPVTEENGVYTADILGKIQTARGKAELELLEKDLRSAGHYYYHTSREEFNKLRDDKSKIDEFFGQLIQDRIRAWVSTAEQRLKGTGIKCFISPGNDDRFSIDPILDASEFVINPEGKALRIDADHEMITLGWSNPTPWNTPRECAEPELEKKIGDLVSQVGNLENSVFNFHCPPYNSQLDMAPKIDNTTLRATTYNVPVGSTAVRQAIEKHKPMLSLHGHIHESRGLVRIGRTICLNPGSEYTEGTLRAYMVTFDEKGVRGYQPISG
jgi:hypothetical protein